MAFSTQEGFREGRAPVQEGALTRQIEEQTGRIPSVGYLGFAMGSMAASAVLAFVLRRREMANFVGLWAPTILILGLYNKLVKIEHESGLVQGREGQQYGSETSSFSRRSSAV
jgi:hypothetical protein